MLEIPSLSRVQIFLRLRRNLCIYECTRERCACEKLPVEACGAFREVLLLNLFPFTATLCARVRDLIGLLMRMPRLAYS